MKKGFLVVGNWKMYQRRARDARKTFRALVQGLPRSRRVSVAVAPPFPFLPLLPRGGRIALAAQDIYWERDGAFTGEVSGSMIKDAGAAYVIVGHSERRRMGETDSMVNKKLKAALESGLRPILCVGEEARDTDGAFFTALKKQIEIAFAKISKHAVRRVVVAYEPVWAVGTGKPARPSDANEAALFIKKILAGRYGIAQARKIRVLYGGSVDARIAPAFLAEQEISGLLVGRQSVDPRKFLEIIRCALSVS